MDIKALLQGVELFSGLTDEDLDEVAALCNQYVFNDGDVLAAQGEPGEELFIIADGLVEVVVRGAETPRVVVNLGSGQLIGEMSLVDQGLRSATVRAIQSPTTVYAIQYGDFHDLCEQNTRIGYRVMLNLAADLSFKLRQRHWSGG